ncbi:hypothetical protein HGRIS_013911 [Hohenbuehelia grisea]|uniref:Proteophosphoglycan ppg4 n=1 Tax=Hohenbuehelia grisea TaxID=104357 RepID=A0ABR3IXB5_9AGAR
MMRDLTSLHASMAAQNKVGNGRGSRRAGAGSASNLAGGSPSSGDLNGSALGNVKQEDITLSMHHSQRPGTSTGYEGDHPGLMYQPPAWHVHGNADAHSRPNSTNHSFRDPGQSFLASQSTSTNNNATAASAQSQSFLPFSSSFNFSVPDSNQHLQRDAGRPRSSASRPTTAGGTSLPPLASVFSAPLPASPPQPPFTPNSASQQSFSNQQQSSSANLLPFPIRRPSTANRPGTAPASSSLVTPSSASYYGRSTFFGGAGGLVSRTSELSVFSHGRGNSDMGAASAGYDPDPASPTSGGYDSPFSFHPPTVTEQQQQSGRGPSVSAYNAAATGSTNPRKRAYAGPDGPNDEHSIAAAPAPPAPAHGNNDYYDYGSESRPQSRRLSVMELCNEPSESTGLGAFLLSPTSGLSAGYGGASRPSTSSGLVTSASALALVDRPSPPLLARAAQAAAAAASPGPAGSYGGSGAGQEEYGGGGLSPATRRGGGLPAAASPAFAASPSPSGSYAAAASPLLPYRGGSAAGVGVGGGFADSPTFSAASPASAYSARSPDAGHVRGVSRRAGSAPDGGDDQVRIAVSPSHSPAIVGMRV